MKLAHTLLLVIFFGLSSFLFIHGRAERAEDIFKMETPKAEAYIRTLAQKNGAITTWENLAKMAEKIIPQRAPEMHSLAHVAGEELYISLGSSGMKYCDPSFANGCYHGFVAAFLQKEGLEASEKITNLCLDTESPGDCAHGVGHGFDEVTGSNLEKSLSLCNATFEEGVAKYCWEGVIMNNSETWDVASTENTNTVCRKLSKKYSAACMSSQVVYMRERQRASTKTIMESCYAGWSKDTEKECARSFGFVLVREKKGEANHIIPECKNFHTTEKNICIAAAAHLVSVNAREGWEKEIHTLCKELPKNFEPTCPTQTDGENL